MSDEKRNVHHVYDGIEEEDNRLPGWWLFILFATIVFGLGYWWAYHSMGWLPGPGVAYAAERQAQLQKLASSEVVSDDALLALTNDPAIVAEGKQTFTTTCASCHGVDGQGLVGPNLTDAYHLHGPKPMNVLDAVSKGFPDKGMPPWGPVLGPKRARSAAVFVLTLRGKNLPGKAPQGELAP